MPLLAPVTRTRFTASAVASIAAIVASERTVNPRIRWAPSQDIRKIFAKIEWKDPIYIHGTRPPPTADETDTESEQEDREDTESDHSIRPVTEREQEDRDEIESDQFIQASPHDSGWVIG